MDNNDSKLDVRKTYTVNMTCKNCKRNVTIEKKYGESMAGSLCPICGCGLSGEMIGESATGGTRLLLD